jgi:hypothetical protein
MFLRAAALTLLTCASLSAQGRGVSPYLPLGISPEIERQIERALILADKPVLTRPIAAATVLDALPRVCERDASLCEQVRRYLRPYMDGWGLTHASLAAAGGSDAAQTLPNRRGMPADSSYEASAQIYFQPSDYALVNAGFVAYEGDTMAAGSVLSLGFQYAQLDLGYRGHWLSPMTDSAMLLSAEAATMPSATISNYTPMTRLGLRYEMFVAELSESSRIRYGDGFTTGSPKIAGLHVSIEPFPGWSLGFNRLLQFGGGARGGQSFRDILDAFFRPSEFDNRSDDLTLDQEFGNQAASITSRFLVPGEHPFAVYFEYAGEDTSASSNYHLGNAALSAGLHFPTLWQRFELTVEASEWQNGWYVHGIYGDGLVNERNVIGHWGADWRAPGDGVGGQSLMARVGWQPATGGFLEGTLRTLDNESYTAASYERAYALDVRYSRPWRDLYFGAELNAGRDSLGESYSRLGAFIRF